MYGFSFDEGCDNGWDVGRTIGCAVGGEMLISICIVNKRNIIIKFDTLKVLQEFFTTFFF
jgi:hypothetical protein